METVKVIFTGSQVEFTKSLLDWLKREPFGESAQIIRAENQDVLVSLPQDQAVEMHTALTRNPSSVAGLVTGIFPSQLHGVDGRELVFGAASDLQKKMVEELAPMTARPDTRTDLLPLIAQRAASRTEH